MVGQLDRGDALGAKGSVIDRTVRIPGNFGCLAVLCVNQNTAAAMAHPAVAFNHGIITVNFHFFLNIGVNEFSHPHLQFN